MRNVVAFSVAVQSAEPPTSTSTSLLVPRTKQGLTTSAPAPVAVRRDATKSTRRCALSLALLQRSVARRVKHRFKPDLYRCAAEIEHDVGYRSPGRVSTDGVHEAIGRHPRKHALVQPVHDHDRVLQRQRERVLGAQMPLQRIENLGGQRCAQQAQPHRRLDRNGRAAAQRIEHRVHRDAQQRIKAAPRTPTSQGAFAQTSRTRIPETARSRGCASRSSQR